MTGKRNRVGICREKSLIVRTIMEVLKHFWARENQISLEDE